MENATTKKGFKEAVFGKFTPARYLTTVAVFAAMSTALRFWEFPIPLFPGFLQFDFSDFPALIATFSLGPGAGIIVELVKNLFHLFRPVGPGVPVGLGELADFVMGCAFIVPAGLVYKLSRNRKGALIGLGVGTGTRILVGIVWNSVVMLPLFALLWSEEAIIRTCSAILPWANSFFRIVLVFISPFNLLKAVVFSVIAFFSYRGISFLIKNIGIKKKEDNKVPEEVFDTAESERKKDN